MSETEAKAARDQALRDTDKYMLADYPITPAGRLLLRAYRQSLRDWPQSAGFPDVATMPVATDWHVYKPLEQPTNGTDIL